MKILKLLWCFLTGLAKVIWMAIGAIFVIPTIIVALILSIGGDDRLFNNAYNVFDKFFFKL